MLSADDESLRSPLVVLQCPGALPATLHSFATAVTSEADAMAPLPASPSLVEGGSEDGAARLSPAPSGAPEPSTLGAAEPPPHLFTGSAEGKHAEAEPVAADTDASAPVESSHAIDAGRNSGPLAADSGPTETLADADSSAAAPGESPGPPSLARTLSGASAASAPDSAVAEIGRTPYGAVLLRLYSGEAVQVTRRGEPGS